MQGSTHGLSIHHKEESRNEYKDEDGRKTVTPDVDTLIMNHKQTPEYSSGCVKVDSVSMG